MKTDAAMQMFLDSLSQLPGSILYRHRNDWRALPPGLAGQNLALDATGLPHWSNAGSYDPAWLDFRSGTNYFSKTLVSTAGTNNFTGTFHFKHAPQSGTATLIRNHRTSATPHTAFALYARSSTDPDAPNAISFHLSDASGSILCRIYSKDSWADDLPHVLFAHYDGATAAATLLIDGQDQIDYANPQHVLTTGTVSRGYPSNLSIGASYSGGTPYSGLLRLVGWDHTANVDPADLYSDLLLPYYIDGDLPAVWNGNVPALWQESAAGDQNDGSIGNYSRTGSPRIRNSPL